MKILLWGARSQKHSALPECAWVIAIVPEWIASEYMKVMTPFSVDILSIAAGLAALGDKEHLKKSTKTVKQGRLQLSNGLGTLCKVYSSDANFILGRCIPEKF